MVGRKYILLFLVAFAFSLNGRTQRLNVGISGGWNLYQNLSSVFQDEPFQFLYAAPYSTEPTDDWTYYGAPYDQVRIARVYGITEGSRANFRLGGAITYQLKNDLRFRLNFNFFRISQRIYYGFQNLVLDIGDEQNQVNSQSPELMDNYITVDKWNNSFDLKAIYDFPIKSHLKPFISVGYCYKIQLASNYSSELIENEESILSNEDNIPGYYNSRVFQDKLFTEFSNEGFNHYISLGVGIRRFGLNMSFNWNISVGTSKYPEYFYNHHFVTMDLTYDILSIPLFK